MPMLVVQGAYPDSPGLRLDAVLVRQDVNTERVPAPGPSCPIRPVLCLGLCLAVFFPAQLGFVCSLNAASGT